MAQVGVTVRRVMAISGALAALMFGQPAAAGNAPIVVGEVAPPPPSSGTTVALLRDVAEREIGGLDASHLAPRRKVVVSIALKHGTEAPVAYAVNATVRDARTGALIAIVNATSTADGAATTQLRRQVAAAAVRSAVRRAAQALGAT